MGRDSRPEVPLVGEEVQVRASGRFNLDLAQSASNAVGKFPTTNRRQSAHGFPQAMQPAGYCKTSAACRVCCRLLLSTKRRISQLSVDSKSCLFMIIDRQGMQATCLVQRLTLASQAGMHSASTSTCTPRTPAD